MTPLQAPQNAEVSTIVTDAIGQPDSGRKKGGRPPLPAPPTCAAETRALVAAEIVKTKPSPSRLRHLRTLLRSFEDAEAQARTEAANRLQQETNDLKRIEMEQKRLEYQRRRELGEQRQSAEGSKRMTALREENSRLQAKVTEQEASMTKLRSEFRELQNKYWGLQMDMSDLKRWADEWASVKTAVNSELKSVCNLDERMTALQTELESLKQKGMLANLDRLQAIVTEIEVLKRVIRGEVVLHG